MNLRILKRHEGVWHFLMFSILLFCYQYLIVTVSNQGPVFNLKALIDFSFQNLTSVFLLGILLLSGFFISRLSQIIYILFSILVFVEGVSIIYNTMDKVVIILSFLMLVSTFIFYFNWEFILSLACYNSNSTKEDIEKSPLIKFDTRYLDKNGGLIGDGILFNWDELTCFATGKTDNWKKIKRIEIEAFGNFFNVEVKIASQNDHGGIGFIIEVNDNETWQSFIELIDKRGFDSEMVVLS